MSKIEISKEVVSKKLSDYASALKKRWPLLLLEAFILAAILALDLCLKDYLKEFLLGKSGMSYTLINGFMDLQYSENTGAGFGMFQGNTTALIVVTAIVIAIICFYLLFMQKDAEWLRIPLVFIVGGGIGNLVDRIALGYVRDFFKFTFVDFAIFNIADVFVTVGAILLIIALIVMMVQEGKKGKAKFEEEQATAATAIEQNQTATFDVQELQASDSAVSDDTDAQFAKSQDGSLNVPSETGMYMRDGASDDKNVVVDIGEYTEKSANETNEALDDDIKK